MSITASQSGVFGVYRVLKNGKQVYVSRTATTNEGLAKSIAEGLTRGEVVRPDGSLMYVAPHTHIAKPIPSAGEAR